MLFKENNLKSTDHCIHSLDEEALSRKHRGEHLSEGNNRLKELLDGKLSPQEIADDPVLASLAERIYGADFIEHIGISRGETKRALADQFSEIDGDDLLIEDIPEIALPMPDDMPPNPANIVMDETEINGSLVSKLQIGAGLIGIVGTLTNVFYGFGNIIGGCTQAMHATCRIEERMKLNWLDFHRTDSFDAWSEVGSIGIPDGALIIAGLWIIYSGWRK